jgi:hypothetical protein
MNWNATLVDIERTYRTPLVLNGRCLSGGQYGVRTGQPSVSERSAVGQSCAGRRKLLTLRLPRLAPPPSDAASPVAAVANTLRSTGIRGTTSKWLYP